MDKNNFIAAMNAAAITPEPGDYIKDGLIYCGKCHTKRQHVIKSKHFGTYTVNCLCECRMARRSQEDAEAVQRRREQRIARNRREGIPDAYRAWTFAKDDRRDPDMSKIARAYVEDFDPRSGEGLLLYGKPSRGKTVTAAMIANALTDRGYKVLMTSFSRLSNTLFGMRDGKQEYIDGLRDYDLIIIDDLGTERDTSTMYETVHNVFEALKGVCMVVTTNLEAYELTNPKTIAERRIFERLLACCDTYAVEGPNRRLDAFRARKAAHNG